MSANNHEHPTPDEIRAMNRSRRLSDATFEQGGAEMVETPIGDQLRLTDNQIEIIRGATEDLKPAQIDRVLGLLSLGDTVHMTTPAAENTRATERRDMPIKRMVEQPESSSDIVYVRYQDANPDTGLHTKEVEQLVQENLHRKALEDKIKAITTPFVGLYADFLPDPTANERTITGKLKSKPVKLGTWTNEKMVGNLDARISSRGKYLPGEKHNTIHSVETTIGRKNYDVSEVRPTLTTMFDAGEIASLKFSDLHPHQRLFQEAFPSPNHLRSFMNQVIPSEYPKKCSLTIDMTAERPYVQVATGWYEDVMCRYVYDAEADAFELVTTPEIDDDYPARERPQTLSVDKYLDIVVDTLSVIPVTHVDLNS